MKKAYKNILKLGVILTMLFLLSGMTVLASGKVTGLKQTGATTSVAAFSWNEVSVPGETIYYHVQYSADRISWKNVTSTYGTLRTEASFTGLSSGSSYFIRVGFQTGYKGEVEGWSDAQEIVTAPAHVETNSMKQTDATTDSVTLQWNAVSGATAYRVYEYENNTKGAQKAVTAGTSVKVSGLSAGSSYRWLVVAERTAGNYTAQSSSGVWITPYTVSKAVSGIKFSGGSSKSKTVNMYWKSQKNISGYQIQVYDYRGKKKVGKMINAGPYADRVTIKNIKATTFYQVKIRSYLDFGGGKKYSAWSTIYTSNQPNLKSSLSNDKIQLSWKKVTGANSYTVYGRKGYSSNRKTYKKIATTKALKLTVSKVAKKKIVKNTQYNFFVVSNKKVKGKTYQSAVNSSYWITLR